MVLEQDRQVGAAVLDSLHRADRAMSLNIETSSSSRPLSSLERRTVLEKTVATFFRDGLLEDVEDGDEGRGTSSLRAFVSR
jgi:hypothetical protein